jgi:hypothetical protein
VLGDVVVSVDGVVVVDGDVVLGVVVVPGVCGSGTALPPVVDGSGTVVFGGTVVSLGFVVPGVAVGPAPPLPLDWA